MKFQIPQFIEVEDKIFGPLTIKQFIYIAGVGGLSIVFYILLPLFLAIFFIIPIIAFSAALAFYKINNKPFVFVLESSFRYMIQPKLYIWKHVPKAVTPEDTKDEKTDSSAFIPKLSDSKLKELSWSLGTKDAVTPVVRETNK